MRQVLVRIPLPFEIAGLKSIPIFGYGTMLFIAFVLTAWIATRRARREGLDPDRFYDLCFWVFVAAIVGARLFYVIEYGVPVQSWLAIWQGGIVFYGGVLGALVVGLIYVRRHRMPVLRVCDVGAPSIILGEGIGRLGCFLNGCCFGRLCSPHLPWGVRFPMKASATQESPVWLHQVQDLHILARDAHWTLPVHPTQIYSFINGVLIFLLLTAFFPFRRRDGEVTVLLMILYGITRFLLECLRDDEPPLADGLTISQNISIVLVAAGIGLWLWIRRRPALPLRLDP